MILQSHINFKNRTNLIILILVCVFLHCKNIDCLFSTLQCKNLWVKVIKEYLEFSMDIQEQTRLSIEKKRWLKSFKQISKSSKKILLNLLKEVSTLFYKSARIRGLMAFWYSFKRNR